ncbi:MAG: bacteriohemerythrin [Leptospirales bacterium]
MLLTWKNSYSVKVKSFDDAHKDLIALINEIHENMQSEKKMEVVASVLDQLSNYTEKHFSEEEELMKKNEFPYYDDHAAEHSKFIKEINRLREKFETNSNLINIQVLYFLKDWLTNHILNTDKKYSGFFNEKGIQ